MMTPKKLTRYALLAATFLLGSPAIFWAIRYLYTGQEAPSIGRVMASVWMGMIAGFAAAFPGFNEK